MTGVAHHDDRDLFLVDWAEYRGGSCGRHPRPQPDRVVHLRHHLFAFARRLVAAGAAQPSELVRRWADVFGGRVARVGRTPAATGDCRADCGRRGRADGDRGVDDSRVVLLFSKLFDRGGAVCGWPRVAARCRGGARREVSVETWGGGRGSCALPLRPHNNKAPGRLSPGPWLTHPTITEKTELLPDLAGGSMTSP